MSIKQLFVSVGFIVIFIASVGPVYSQNNDQISVNTSLTFTLEEDPAFARIGVQIGATLNDAWSTMEAQAQTVINQSTQCSSGWRSAVERVGLLAESRIHDARMLNAPSYSYLGQSRPSPGVFVFNYRMQRFRCTVDDRNVCSVQHVWPLSGCAVEISQYRLRSRVDMDRERAYTFEYQPLKLGEVKVTVDRPQVSGVREITYAADNINNYEQQLAELNFSFRKSAVESAGNNPRLVWHYQSEVLSTSIATYLVDACEGKDALECLGINQIKQPGE